MATSICDDRINAHRMRQHPRGKRSGEGGKEIDNLAARQPAEIRRRRLFEPRQTADEWPMVRVHYYGKERMQIERLETYLSQIDKVEGWLSNTTAIISFCLMVHQTCRGTKGNAVEIGVFRGRYFIVLANALGWDEKAVAIDNFEDHYEKLIPVEGGQRSVFEQNVRTYADAHSLILINSDSTKLKPGDITAHGPVRFMSIDGGHTCQVALNDLRLAEAVLTPDGVATLDDIVNDAWPGVLAAWKEYRNSGGQLTAFAMLTNKLALCRPEFRDIYTNLMRAAFKDALTVRDDVFVGETIDYFGDLPAERLIPTLKEAFHSLSQPEQKSPGGP